MEISPYNDINKYQDGDKMSKYPTQFLHKAKNVHLSDPYREIYDVCLDGFLPYLEASPVNLGNLIKEILKSLFNQKYYRVLTSYVMSTPKNPERGPNISCKLYTTHYSGKPKSISRQR